MTKGRKMEKTFQEKMLGGTDFSPVPSPDGFGELWRSYRSRQGAYWGWFHFLSPREADWSISIHDFVMDDDFVMSSETSDYLTVTYFKSISGEEFNPYRKLRPNSLWGQSFKGEPWKGIAHAGIPVQSISIEVSHEFSRRFLEKEYPDGFASVEEAFVSLGNDGEHLELKALLAKLWPVPGGQSHSALYYEGKVLEAMGLIVEGTRQPRARTCKPVSSSDWARIQDVVRYIDDHCSSALRIADLSAIACMSPTKFKETFKKANGKTVTGYVQERRMSQAELLLRQPDLTIEQIARSVGYTCTSRFSELFRREVGMLPSEYRKALRP